MFSIKKTLVSKVLFPFLVGISMEAGKTMCQEISKLKKETKKEVAQ